MPTSNVRNTIRNVLEIDALIRKAVQKSWDVQFSLSRYDEGAESLFPIRQNVEEQIRRLVKRALEEADKDIQECGFTDFMPHP